MHLVKALGLIQQVAIKSCKLASANKGQSSNKDMALRWFSENINFCIPRQGEAGALEPQRHMWPRAAYQTLC